MTCSHRGHKVICRFDTVSLYRCDTCGLIFSDRQRKPLDPKKLYEKYYYRNEIAGRFRSGVEYVLRAFRFFRAFKIFTIYPGAESILDIGSGRGFLLYYLKKYYGYKRTAGTQISKNAVDFSRDELGLEIYDRDLLEIFSGDDSFDVITMWHVLEHVDEPEKYIAKIYSLLNAGGKLVIEVPNFSSWTRALTKAYWLGLDPDYHVTFFTPESLRALLEKYGFSIKAKHTFSLEYSTFISAQSFVSLFTGSDHIFFRYLQTTVFERRIIWHIFLFILLAPACFLVNLLLYFSKRGEVLLVVAEKPGKTVKRRNES